MDIHHVISTIDISSGGPARSVTHLIESIHSIDKDIEIELSSLKTAQPIITKFVNNRGRLNLYKSGRLGYSSMLIKNLKDSEAKLFHGHGLWELPVHHMAAAARKNKIPYIITPRGMLEPWSLEQGSLKKKLALKLFQYKDLKKADCLHATAPMEVESIRKLGLKNPVAMIPNGVNVAEFDKKPGIKSDEPKKILFLSRIHVKKGIENLIDAWSLLSNKDSWVIEIIGNGDALYIQSLKEKIKAANLENEIFIKPPLFGKEKIEAFRSASLFVLPTFSENFGIVIAEALAGYTPVITTKGAPWEDLNKHNCGWWIDIGVDPLKAALEEAMSCDAKELLVKGSNGRKLIEEKYSMESVAKKMTALYRWTISKKDKPEFIDII